MKTRRIISVLLALVILFALAACTGNTSPSSNANTDNGNTEDPGTEKVDSRRYDNTRDIYIGVWWDTAEQYYSDRTELSPTESNPMRGQMQLDNMRAIEERYNVRLHCINMTFDGARESINTSIMAGTPDVDIYAMDLQWAIPIITNGYCMPISEYVKDKNNDIYTDQTVLMKLNVCGMDEDYVFKASPALVPNDIYTLAFNWDLLQEHGQPNPQDLWDNDEWTWDAMVDIMKAVTDTSKTVPTYGWSCEHNRSLENMLAANGANIAMTDTQMINSAPVIEVFEFYYKLYNEWNVARPWDGAAEYWDNCKYNDGTIGFFTFAPWLAQRFGVSKSEDCPYEIKVVPWPIGPSGNKETNNTSNMSGNVYMIPIGTKDPDIVYDVYFDYTNWHNYDTSLRDDFTWMEDLVVEERGFDYMLYGCSKPQFDMWNMMGMQDSDGNGFSVVSLFDASETPSQLTEKWKLIVQDYIDIAYGKK